MKLYTLRYGEVGHMSAFENVISGWKGQMPANLN